jgi:hypothetical protein
MLSGASLTATDCDVAASFNVNGGATFIGGAVGYAAGGINLSRVNIAFCVTATGAVTFSGAVTGGAGSLSIIDARLVSELSAASAAGSGGIGGSVAGAVTLSFVYAELHGTDFYRRDFGGTPTSLSASDTVCIAGGGITGVIPSFPTVTAAAGALTPFFARDCWIAAADGAPVLLLS